jgi:BCD family chlorophyll transporter-like MFS transporter
MVGLMYVMLLVGMTIAAIIYGWALADFTHLRLVQVIQGSAIATIVLNVVAMWRQETRNRTQAAKLDDPNRRDPEFMAEWRRFIAGDTVRRRLVAIGLGTMGFGMADVLLEPYGGQVLSLAVADTTRLTALMAVGSIAGFMTASRQIGRGTDPVAIAGLGAIVGILAFMAIIAAAPMGSAPAYILGTLMVGIGAGLFGHGTLTATMQSAPDQQAGMALGAWGAFQATAAGLGLAFAGIIRDLVAGTTLAGTFGAATGYLAVYGLEILLLTATLVAIAPLVWPRNATESALH